MCAKPKFINIKKEVETKLKNIQFSCQHASMGCTKVLSYAEVQTHDAKCKFAPVKCEAYKHCKVKCIRKDIEKHQAVCPNILVPCIYCREQVMRVKIMEHEQSECPGTHACNKCGMTVVKEETKKNTHNCFNSLAGYLQNMMQSKDYVINVFKEELNRKNRIINDLLEK